MSTIHLQSLGSQPAIPASELQPGMLISWNYSYEGYEIASVSEASPKFLSVVERDRETGKEYTRRLLKTRTVAAWFPGQKPAAVQPRTEEERRAAFVRDWKLSRKLGQKSCV